MLFSFLQRTITKVIKLDTDFLRLFFDNEYEALAGASNRRIKALTGMLFLAFLALSFAIGSLGFLKTKMDNPFTNWVDMPVLHRYESKIDAIKKFYEQEDIQQSLNLSGITEYVRFSPELFHFQDNNRYRMLGMTFDPNGDLIRHIIQENNQLDTLFNAKGHLLEKHLGSVVVTRKMLSQLGCDYIPQQKMLVFADEKYRRYVPILAIVDALPNLSDFACTPRLYNWMTESWDDTGCIFNQGKTNDFYFISKISDTNKLKTIFKENMPEYGVNNIHQDLFTINENSPDYIYRVFFDDLHSVAFKENVFQKLKQNLGPDSLQTFWFQKWNCSSYTGVDNIKNPYYLAFNFSELNSIRTFGQQMQENFEVEISMNQVEAKENFVRIANLTFIISSILFIFALLSILLFIRNLLSSHLEKIKSNLGTFKAFGLSNDLLVANYRNIVLSFLVISMVLAFALVGLIVSVEEILSGSNSFLNIFNIWMLLAIFLIFVISSFYVQKTIQKTLSHTPGDLIYNRV